MTLFNPTFSRFIQELRELNVEEQVSLGQIVMRELKQHIQKRVMNYFGSNKQKTYKNKINRVYHSIQREHGR